MKLQANLWNVTDHKHWEKIMTIHVRTSKIHEFSHSGLKSLAKKSEREKKKGLFAYSEGKTINKPSQMGKPQDAEPRMLISCDQVYNLRGELLCSALLGHTQQSH